MANLRNLKYLMYSGMAFLGCVIIYFIAPPTLPKETESHGWLLPADDPTLRTGCDPIDDPNDQGYWAPLIGGLLRSMIPRPKNPPPKTATIVALGNNGIIVTKSDKVPIVKIAQCTLLSIENAPNGLLIDASVYDVAGRLIAS